jgi:hypothetical protein
MEFEFGFIVLFGVPRQQRIETLFDQILRLCLVRGVLDDLELADHVE